jgi:hypothetical protein
MTYCLILDDRPEISVPFLKMIIIFSKKPLEIMKKYPIKYSMFRMTLTIDPRDDRKEAKANIREARTKIGEEAQASSPIMCGTNYGVIMGNGVAALHAETPTGLNARIRK